MKRTALLILALLMLVSFVACQPTTTTSPTTGTTASSGTTKSTDSTTTTATTAAPTENPFDSADDPYPWNDPAIGDTSDLPAWAGKEQKLVWWFGHGIGNLAAETATNDVVWPEVKRVTGVEIDYENSYSNGDNTFDVKLSLLAGTKDWPSISTNAQLVKPLVDGGVLYDLTDLVPKYCPNIMSMYGPDDPNFKSLWSLPNVNGGQEGKIYGVPIGVGADYSMMKDKLGITEDDPKYLTAFSPPSDYIQGCIKVRDDILKTIFPTAKTMNEIEELYMKNGKFTREEVFDVPIKSKEDFVQFLRDIKALDLKEGSLPVYPTYAACGLDNYPLGARLASELYGWGRGGDCFTFWDNTDKKIKLTANEPELKDLFLTFNQLIREGVIPQESLIDDDTAFKAKMNNGQYAVTYAEWRWADDQILVDAGKTYRYRPVYLDIPVNTDKYIQPLNIPNCNQLLIFKDTVSPEDVPQILMWIDYQMSKNFDKLQYWGPESAGLFEEINGKRVFKDKAIEEAMLYNNDPNTLMKYSLKNGFFNVTYNPRRISLVASGVTLNVPYMVYGDVQRNKKETLNYFKSGLVEKYDTKLTNLPWIWIFPNSVPGVEKMWAARTTWEDALMRTLAATSEEEFNKLYDDFLKTAADIGLTPETVEAMTQDFTKQNALFMDNLMN